MSDELGSGNLQMTVEGKHKIERRGTRSKGLQMLVR